MGLGERVEGEGSAESALSPGGGPPAAGAGPLPEEPLRDLSEPQVPAGGGTATWTLTGPPDLPPLTSTDSRLPLGLHLWPLTPIHMTCTLCLIDHQGCK